MIDDIPAVGSTYAAMREELIALAGGLSVQELTLVVPQCPEWSVRDVVAHVVGVNADIVGRNLEGMGSDAWTSHQVESRSSRSLDEVCGEWESLGESTMAFMAGEPFMEVRLCADLATHIHDMLGALGRSDDGLDVSGRRGVGVRMALDRYGPYFCERAAEAGLPVVRIIATDGTQTWQSVEAAPSAELSATAFELLRAVTGRRSAAQVLAMDWVGDPAPFIDVMSPYGMPDSDIIE